jgi:Tol biopolymer transport system component/DNA-binding winged helix-turn-helix (wHTH) protein
MDNSSGHKIYEFGDFSLHCGDRMLYRLGAEVSLSPKAVETLIALVDRRGQIVSKYELLSAVWPDTTVEESNLFLYLSILRKTLGTDPNGKPWIETLRRRGYRFCGEARVNHDSAGGGHADEIENAGRYKATVETRSGRLYLLKDWNGPTAESVSMSRSHSTLRALKPEVISNETDRGDLAAPTAKFGPDERVQPVAEPLNRGRSTRRSPTFWIVIAIAVVAASGAGLFVYRSGGEQKPMTKELSQTPLTNGADVQGAAISPDGKTFVYQTFDGEYDRLFLQQVGQLNSIEILATKTGIGPKTFSPDGYYLYYLSKNSGESQLSLYRIPAYGGAPKKVLTDVFYQSAVSFSPDGSEFVFSRYENDSKKASLVVARTDGSGERDILSSTSEMLIYPAWSPDGKTIAFSRSRRKARPKDQYDSIETVNPNGGTPRILLNEKFSNSFRIAWTSSGDGIVFGGTKFGEHMTGRRDQVWIASLKTGKVTRISPEGTRYVFEGLTDENAALMFPLNRPSQIWEINVNGNSGTAKQLTKGTSEGRTGIAPLPDGRIGYTLRNGDNWEIWIMNGDGSNQKQIFNANPITEELRATTDGKYFVFNGEVAGNYQLFRLNTDGTDLKQLTFGDIVYVSDSSPSSDSRFVLFTRVAYQEDERGVLLYRIPIDGGEPVPVEGATLGAYTPHHSPDGKFISYIDATVTPSRLAVMGVGEPKPRFYEVSNGSQLNVGAIWTPDSKALAYIVSSEKVSNVWIQPIDGGPPHQLTDFTSGRIHRIAFSADGNRLYLARGYGVNDVLLVKGFAD